MLFEVKWLYSHDLSFASGRSPPQRRFLCRSRRLRWDMGPAQRIGTLRRTRSPLRAGGRCPARQCLCGPPGLQLGWLGRVAGTPTRARRRWCQSGWRHWANPWILGPIVGWFQICQSAALGYCRPAL